MKLSYVAIAGVCVIIIGFCSCKKKHDASPQSNLIGKWKQVMVVADSNGNGVWDVHDAVDSINTDIVLDFSSGGAGTIFQTNISIGTFSWELLTNNTYLKTTYPTSVGSAIQHIDSLTAKTLVLKDTTGISIMWNVFAKQ